LTTSEALFEALFLEEDDDFPYDFLRMLCDILDLLEEAVSEDGESDVFEQNISTAIDIIEDIILPLFFHIRKHFIHFFPKYSSPASMNLQCVHFNQIVISS